MYCMVQNPFSQEEFWRNALHILYSAEILYILTHTITVIEETADVSSPDHNDSKCFAMKDSSCEKVSIRGEVRRL